MGENAGLYIIFGTMILFTMVVCVYDFLSERQHRRGRERDHHA